MILKGRKLLPRGKIFAMLCQETKLAIVKSSACDMEREVKVEAENVGSELRWQVTL